MTSIKGLVGAVLLVAALVVAPREADAKYCPNGWGKWHYTSWGM